MLFFRDFAFPIKHYMWNCDVGQKLQVTLSYRVELTLTANCKLIDWKVETRMITKLVYSQSMVQQCWLVEL